MNRHLSRGATHPANQSPLMAGQESILLPLNRESRLAMRQRVTIDPIGYRARSRQINPLWQTTVHVSLVNQYDIVHSRYRALFDNRLDPWTQRLAHDHRTPGLGTPCANIAGDREPEPHDSSKCGWRIAFEVAQQRGYLFRRYDKFARRIAAGQQWLFALDRKHASVFTPGDAHAVSGKRNAKRFVSAARDVFYPATRLVRVEQPGARTL